MSDLISREDAVETICKLSETVGAHDQNVMLVVASYLQNTKDFPTIEAEPVKHGRWRKLYRGNYECSLCGDWWTFSVPNTEIVQAFKYCPHCGARMDGGENGI